MAKPEEGSPTMTSHFVPAIDPETRLLTGAEVAARLQISRAFGYRLMATGQIPTIRIGRCVRVLESDLRAYIIANRGQETESAE